MYQNGSPEPRFDFDRDRTYFRVTLPAHPEYQAILALQDIANLRAMDETAAVFDRLKVAWANSQGSLGIALELAREYMARGDIPAAESVYERYTNASPAGNPAALIALIAGAYLDRSRQDEAIRWLDRLPTLEAVSDAFDAAIQEKRARRYERAHSYFLATGDAVMQDAKALHEFAQVKIKLAEKARPRGKNGSWAASHKLLSEAKEMLQRVVQMDAPRARHAWAWFDLGRVLKYLRSPTQDIRHAYEQAAQLQSDERRFQEALKRLDSYDRER